MTPASFSLHLTQSFSSETSFKKAKPMQACFCSTCEWWKV